MRLIDADELKRKLDAWKIVPNYVYKALDDTPTIEQTNTAEWILCKDRLPEIGQRVLVSLRRYNYRKGEPKNTRRSDRFSYKVSIDTLTESNCFQRNPLGIIIAWQPLPEPLIQEKAE